MKEYKFKIGDRVKYIGGYTYLREKSGTVITTKEGFKRSISTDMIEKVDLSELSK